MSLKHKGANAWMIQEPGYAACSIEKALDAIGGKWSFLVIRELFDGPRRFGELKRQVRGVSPKSLATTLRQLETSCILTRTVHPSTPPMVEYALTDKGNALRPIIHAMKAWGAQWA